ncbi:MAG: methyltransferase, partial [Dokdonella sp.]
VEAEAEALVCARVNIPDPRAKFHWADATTFKPVRLWDSVVMNPPFHTAREADAGLGIAFIKAAQRGLSPSGSLWMVANRHLPYEITLKQRFEQVRIVAQSDGYKIFHARGVHR